MKRLFLFSVALLSLMAFCCGNQASARTKAMRVIYDTDLGNDVDDVMALDMLFKYMDAGKIKLLGVMINKVEDGPVEYVDILRNWYGYPDLPIGTIKEGADCSHDGVNYAKAVADLKNEDGTPMFKRSGDDYSEYPLAVDLYRKLLARQPDSSVTIISTGFSTNLARLLDSRPDKYSKLSGKELVARKVKFLCTMAGCLADNVPEYNIYKDIPSAQKVFSEWPGKIVDSPFEVGISITYPGRSIENDFRWAGKHPMVEGYKAYLPMPYDRPTWDMTSVLYAVEESGRDSQPFFGMVGPCHIAISDKAGASFTPDPSGNRYYLTADSLQRVKVLARFKELLTTEPLSVSKARKK